MKSIRRSSLGVGQGFMCQLARLGIDYESAPDDAPRSLIAKLPTADQLDGASAEQARRVLSEIARVHASWWEDPRPRTG